MENESLLQLVGKLDEVDFFADANDDDSLGDNWTIPLPKNEQQKQQKRPAVDSKSLRSSPTSPLLVPTRTHPVTLSRRQTSNVARNRTSHLVGDDHSIASNDIAAHQTDCKKPPNQRGNDERPHGVSGLLFGFMYEEPINESMMDYSFDEDLEETSKPSVWNAFNLFLFIAYTLTSLATTAPVLVVSAMGQQFLEAGSSEASAFVSRAASSAVLGTACGKFINGPVGDLLGARRVMVFYSTLLGVSLFCLACCQTANAALWMCFFVEFFQSVQWPCLLIMLATHYGQNHYSYEGGIYVTSIASRFGSLLGIQIYSSMMRNFDSWRLVCLMGAWVAMIGCSVTYLFLMDSPNNVNEAQNALNADLVHQISVTNPKTSSMQYFFLVRQLAKTAWSDNIKPSLRHVLRSGIFWIVALAHTGSSMIRTSDRILGTYLMDTSDGTLDEANAGGFTIVASIGTILGLAIAGAIFSRQKEAQRKWLVSRLYIVTITSCYCLAALAIPLLRQWIQAPGLVLFLQSLAAFCMSFGIAVMLYQIPGLVGSTFGSDKGLFAAYTDGVAYAIASVVWKIVANAVSEGDTDEDNDTTGGGWAYGWAAVALLLVLCSIVMVEFMEHYFVRASGRHYGSYETIIFG